jgi:hypothetical protein
MTQSSHLHRWFLLSAAMLLTASSVRAQDKTVVYANPATSNIQNDLDNPSYSRIIVPYNGSAWISGQLTIPSNKELVLQSGVVLEAQSGSFTSDIPFIRIESANNVTITGNGATIRMPLTEYSNGEHRHGISVMSSSNITIQGVIVEKSGGDGIYLGNAGTPNYNDTVVIRDVVCDGNARNGIGIISVRHLTIEDSVFKNTGRFNPSGVAAGGPWAGIDFEPNLAAESMQDIVVERSQFLGNKNNGILFALSNQTSASPAISITVGDCLLDGAAPGLTPTKDGILAASGGNPSGSITVSNCELRNFSDRALFFMNWQAPLFTMEDSFLINPVDDNNKNAIEIKSTDANAPAQVGNIAFENTHVRSSRSLHALRLNGFDATHTVANVSGTIYSDYPDADILSEYTGSNSVTLERLTGNFGLLNSGNADGICGTDSEDFFTGAGTKVYLGDFSGDGRTDLFVKGYGTYRALYYAKSDVPGVFWRPYMGNVDGIAGTTNGAQLTDASAEIYPGDYNGDGKTDMFVKGYGTWRLLYLAGTGGFSSAFSGNADGVGGTDSEGLLTDTSAKVYPGDYNGDGKTDLFVKGFGTWRTLYLGSSSGNFTKAWSGDVDGVGGTDSEGLLTDATAKVYPGDYNGDGNTDLFVKGYGTSRTMYLGSASGNFTTAFSGTTNGLGGLSNQPLLTDASAEVYAADFSGDGRTDFFVKGYQQYRALYLARADVQGHFVQMFASDTDDLNGLDNDAYVTDPTAKLTIGDFNGDGRADLFFKGYQQYRALYLATPYGSGFRKIFAGNADGLGGTDSDAFLTDSAGQVYPGDFDGNGNTDLLIKGYGLWRAEYQGGKGYETFTP